MTGVFSFAGLPGETGLPDNCCGGGGGWRALALFDLFVSVLGGAGGLRLLPPSPEQLHFEITLDIEQLTNEMS